MMDDEAKEVINKYHDLLAKANRLFEGREVDPIYKVQHGDIKELYVSTFTGDIKAIFQPYIPQVEIRFVVPTNAFEEIK